MKQAIQHGAADLFAKKAEILSQNRDARRTQKSNSYVNEQFCENSIY
jgi:hypothetical protein